MGICRTAMTYELGQQRCLDGWTYAKRFFLYGEDVCLQFLVILNTRSRLHERLLLFVWGIHGRIEW